MLYNQTVNLKYKGFKNIKRLMNKNTNQKEIKLWDYQWQQFSKNIFFKPNIKVTNEIINLFSGKVFKLKVLEVGAGSGSDCITLAKKGAEVSALDFSKNALEVYQQLAKNKGIKIKKILADCQKIPIQDNYFDLVFSVGLIEHFKNPVPVIQEQLRVLKRGGFLVIDVPQTYNPYTIVKHVRMVLNIHPFGWETEYSLKKLKKLAEILKIKPICFYGRDSAFINRLPKLVDLCWRKIFAKIEKSKLAPFVCLSIGAIYKK